MFHLRGVAEIDAVQGIARDPLYNNRRQETGPFDLIGDVHGCYDELVALLDQARLRRAARGRAGRPRPGRAGDARRPGGAAIFLGDLVDRGPASPQVLRLVMSMVRDGAALCVPGNHDIKLLRHLSGKK
ncbi:MAG: metallophosphoesterase [Hymenobacter sp.]